MPVIREGGRKPADCRSRSSPVVPWPCVRRKEKARCGLNCGNRWNIGYHGSVLVVAFVVQEPEQAIPDERPTDIKADLLAVRTR